MQFYSALSSYKILKRFLRNLNKSDNSNSQAILRLKNAVLLRIAEVETPELRAQLDSSRPGEGL